MTVSTRCSVSGRGIKTAGETTKSSPQNSWCPVMYCERHAGRALRQHLVVARFFLGCEFALGMGVEIGAVDAEDEYYQHLGIHARRAHVRGFQTIDRRCEGLLQYA